MTQPAQAPSAAPAPGAQRYVARDGDYWLTPLTGSTGGTQLAWGSGPGQANGLHQLNELTSLPEAGTLYSICVPGGTVVTAALLPDPA